MKNDANAESSDNNEDSEGEDEDCRPDDGDNGFMIVINKGQGRRLRSK